MYEPKWPFLLMYGSHDVRHTGVLQVDRLSTDPWDLGRHSVVAACLGSICHLCHYPAMPCRDTISMLKPKLSCDREYQVAT